MQKVWSSEITETFTLKYCCSTLQWEELNYLFLKLRIKKIIAHIFIGWYKKLRPYLKLVLHTNLSSYQEMLSLYQSAKTQYWTCDGPNRHLHVGRSADQRRWQRTLDSSMMDTAYFNVHCACSCCDYASIQHSQQYASWQITKHCSLYCFLSTGQFHRSMNWLTSHR